MRDPLRLEIERIRRLCGNLCQLGSERGSHLDTRKIGRTSTLNPSHGQVCCEDGAMQAGSVGGYGKMREVDFDFRQNLKNCFWREGNFSRARGASKWQEEQL